MARISGKAGSVYIATAEIESCEDAWNESAGTGVTATADTSDYKVGSASAKFALTAAALVEKTATEVITSLDISTYTDLMFWAKCSIGLNAADFQLLLDDTALCASPIVTADIPALSAGVWKLCKVTATLTGCTAIISVGLQQAVDKGALNIWIDDFRAAKAIAGIKNWTLDYTFDVIDVTGFDSSGHRAFFPVLDQWSGSFDGFKDGAPLTIGTVLSADFMETATSTQAWRGEIILTGAHPFTSVDGVVLYTYDFQGTDLLAIPTT